MGDDQDHGELTGQHGATGIGDIAPQTEQYLGDAGHDSGAVLTDDGNGIMQNFWLLGHTGLQIVLRIGEICEDLL
jgi:hypothetical protein